MSVVSQCFQVCHYTLLMCNFNFFEIKFIYHKTHHFNHFKAESPVIFSKFTKLYHYLLHLIPEHFYHHLNKTDIYQAVTPVSHQLLATANWFSILMCLTNLHISYPWNHTICGLSCGLLSFSILFQGSYNLQQCISTSFFLWLNHIPFHVYTTIYIAIYQLTNVWVISTFWIL